MRAHLFNAAYGVFDYATHPVGMLLIAPVLLHHLGRGQHGEWVAATATVSAVSIIAPGFDDADIQYVASLRNKGDVVAWRRAARSMIGVHGKAVARLFYGLGAPLIYLPLIRLFRGKRNERLPAPNNYSVCEDV